MTQRDLFLRHLGQTSPSPLMLEIEKAEGIYLFDVKGKRYMDMISGISVSNTGHRHPAVLRAIREQSEKYLHLMVYGEFVQSPQVKYAELLAANLPPDLSCVYFTNSGTEAVEGALKLAKRLTGRTQIISFKNSYHGHTQGALSIMGNEEAKRSFRPLIPGNVQGEFNDRCMIDSITTETAAVIMEPIQAEAGIILPEGNCLKTIHDKCKEVGALFILDEIQTGMGRTGTLFAFEQYDCAPDVLLLAKALGGGLPLGAFISSKKNMDALTSDPPLGHLTTFGGNALCCAAGRAALEVVLSENLIAAVETKNEKFRNRLKHPAIKNFRSAGLLMALEFYSPEFNTKVIEACIANGILTDWFLFAPQCLRLAPPLIISVDEIEIACNVILECIEKVWQDRNAIHDLRVAVEES